MPNTQDNASATEDMSFEETTDFITEVEERVPVEIPFAAGDKVKIKGTVVAVENDAITIEIDDGIENNVHRVTLNSNQAAAALK